MKVALLVACWVSCAAVCLAATGDDSGIDLQNAVQQGKLIDALLAKYMFSFMSGGGGGDSSDNDNGNSDDNDSDHDNDNTSDNDNDNDNDSDNTSDNEDDNDNDSDDVDLPDVSNPNRLSDSEKAFLVGKHNILRRQERASNMEKLFWSEELAEKAQEHARDCTFDHHLTTWPDSTYPNVGQNLYIGTTRDLEDAVQDWYDEIDFYDYGSSRPCRTGKVCGHYTQVVWAKSREVGCGVYFCERAPSESFNTVFRNMYIITCNYGPAGNTRGVLPYLRGSPCTKCHGEAVWCSSDLCVSTECHDADCRCDARCRNSGDMDRSTCTCSCEDGYSGAYCAEECRDMDPTCGPLNGWPQSWCGDPQYPEVADGCPLMCGKCVPRGGHVCEDSNAYCNANPGWNVGWCDNEYVQYECKKMCGVCT